MNAMNAMKTGKIGQFTVSRVVESEGPFAPLRFIVPEITDADIDAHSHWLKPVHVDADDCILMCYQSYVLKTPHHTILVDACVGNHKERVNRPPWHRQDFQYLDTMRRSGVQPEDIDFVCCTHMHADHVGWNTCLRNNEWVPTFPNARYVFAKKEYSYWETAHREALANGLDAPNHGSFSDSVLPIVDAGRAVMVESDFEFETGIHLAPAYGHTAGNCMLHAHSQGEHGIFTGDVLHTAAQLIDLSWSSRFCHDPKLSQETRAALVQDVADTSTRLFTAHFPSPSAGRIVSRKDHFRFEFS